MEKDWKKMNVYEKAIHRWGQSAQWQMMIEEMSELTQEICKMFRQRTHHVPEEVADVDIMLSQMKYMFPTWKKHKKEKLKRLQEIFKS